MFPLLYEKLIHKAMTYTARLYCILDLKSGKQQNTGVGIHVSLSSNPALLCSGMQPQVRQGGK